jgi:transmembrane sensor
LGSKSHMVLPDGSDVWLNAGTTIEYPSNFSSKQRDIFLTGEAYFKVASNKKWPFIVHTSDLNIKALGTAFNVKAYPSEKTVTTTLVEGVVKLENAKRNFTYTLKPKQELVFLKEPGLKKEEKNISNPGNLVSDDNKKLESIQNAFVKNEINTETSVSWKDKRWIIHGETIENLAIMLERRYDIKINVISEELNQFKFSGTIQNETVEQVLNYLRYTIPMKYTLNKGSVDLKIDNALKEKYKVFLRKEDNYHDSSN